MVDFDALQPVRTTAPNFTTEVANSSGTTINPAEDYAQGSTTSGENNILAGGATTTAAPTYTTATTNPLSLDTSGNLRVLTGSGSTTAVTGNVTVVQPTGANLHVDVDNFPADSDAYAQGSTTSGQLGNLPLGATTTAAPTYVTGTSNPLSLDTSGNLRVAVENTPPTPTPVLTYFTDSAVASGATTTHSVAGPVSLNKIDFTASGEMKGTVAIGITGSEVTYWNGFNSASHQDFGFSLIYPYVIPTGSSVKVTLKNRDTNAQDLYVTFFTH
jgi:hypothetical protein